MHEEENCNKSWGGSKDGLMPRWWEVQEEEKFNKQGGPQDRGDPDRQGLHLNTLRADNSEQRVSSADMPLTLPLQHVVMRL